MADSTAIGPVPNAQVYDILHRASASPIMRRLWQRAWGADHPWEVDPSSSCTWWTLGQAVGALRLFPGGLLVDLGCGRGGAGLWLARATSANLVGIDFSQVALDLARQRVADFLLADRAEFRSGTLTETGLPDAAADGAVSIDALQFATDLDAALRELCRLLKPGARAVIASREAESIGPAGRTWSAWLRAIGRSGLRLEQRLTEHGRQQRWRALYDLWRTHEAELRAEIGDAPTDLLIEEARDVQALTSHRPMLLVLRRPS